MAMIMMTVAAVIAADGAGDACECDDGEDDDSDLDV